MAKKHNRGRCRIGRKYRQYLLGNVIVGQQKTIAKAEVPEGESPGINPPFYAKAGAPDIFTVFEYQILGQRQFQTSGGFIYCLGKLALSLHYFFDRSEERRVGKECRSRWT